jgi:cytolysin-activating lysine-acyltransferase
MAFWSKKREAGGSNSPPVAADSSAQPLSQDQPMNVLSAEEQQQRVVASKQQMAAFGAIVSIFMRSPAFRNLPLAELESLVVPAIATNQFLIAEAHSKENGSVTPVGAALWAEVSADVDNRLSMNLGHPLKIAPNEWKSGDIAWLIAVAGGAEVVNSILHQLRKTTFGESPLKLLARDKNGRLAVGTLSPTTL